MPDWLRRLFLRYFDRPDPAWRPTGIRPLIADPYDYEQARRAAKRAQTRTESGRRVARHRRRQ
jgi:hypothetical protein